jgi:hypothetical protein
MAVLFASCLHSLFAPGMPEVGYRQAHEIKRFEGVDCSSSSAGQREKAFLRRASLGENCNLQAS